MSDDTNTNPTEVTGPTSRVAQKLAERRLSKPAETTTSAPSNESPAQKPIQAYIPEQHETESAPRGKKRGDRSVEPTPKKLFGAELRRSLDDDIESDLAEALGSFESMDKIAEPSLPSTMDGSEEKSTDPHGPQKVVVIAVRGDNVIVELGGKSEGLIPVIQFEKGLPSAGDIIEVIVDRYNDETGLHILRLPGASQEADWGSVEKGMIVDALVKAVNKGGLEVTVNGLRGFMPAGQVDLGRIEDLSTLVGKVLRSEVTEANVSARNLVVSRKNIQKREREELAAATRASLEAGQVKEGVVRKLMDFGAFVDIGGLDGLIHISQLSWRRVKHPSEIIREGERVKVQVVSFDPDTNKLALSLRDLFENPWKEVAQRFASGTIVPGKVTRITEFGAFVELEPGVEGLIHISEVSGRRISRVSEVLKEGQTVDVKVLEVDIERQRIALSLKGAIPAAPAEAEAEEIEEEEAPAAKPIKKSNVPLKGGLGGSSGPLFGSVTRP